MHYEFDWLVTFEAIADTPEQAEEKAQAFRYELQVRYSETPDIWLTRIRKYKGKAGSNS